MIPVAEERTWRRVLQFGPVCQLRMSGWHAPAGRIRVMSVYGLVTPSYLPGVQAALAEAERAARAVAAVLVLSQAVVAASADEVAEAELAALETTGQLAPRALVVAPVNLPVFRRYAWAMAQAGVGRYVFTDSQMAPALRWAQSMGALVQSEGQWRSRAATRRR
jgi:hypothetical protein